MYELKSIIKLLGYLSLETITQPFEHLCISASNQKCLQSWTVEQVSSTLLYCYCTSLRRIMCVVRGMQSDFSHCHTIDSCWVKQIQLLNKYWLFIFVRLLLKPPDCVKDFVKTNFTLHGAHCQDKLVQWTLSIIYSSLKLNLYKQFFNSVCLFRDQEQLHKQCLWCTVKLPCILSLWV